MDVSIDTWIEELIIRRNVQSASDAIKGFVTQTSRFYCVLELIFSIKPEYVFVDLIWQNISALDVQLNAPYCSRGNPGKHYADDREKRHPKSRRNNPFYSLVHFDLPMTMCLFRFELCNCCCDT